MSTTEYKVSLTLRELWEKVFNIQNFRFYTLAAPNNNNVDFIQVDFDNLDLGQIAGCLYGTGATDKSICAFFFGPNYLANHRKSKTVREFYFYQTETDYCSSIISNQLKPTQSGQVKSVYESLLKTDTARMFKVEKAMFTAIKKSAGADDKDISFQSCLNAIVKKYKETVLNDLNVDVEFFNALPIDISSDNIIKVIVATIFILIYYLKYENVIWTGVKQSDIITKQQYFEPLRQNLRKDVLKYLGIRNDSKTLSLSRGKRDWRKNDSNTSMIVSMLDSTYNDLEADPDNPELRYLNNKLIKYLSIELELTKRRKNKDNVCKSNCRKSSRNNR